MLPHPSLPSHYTSTEEKPRYVDGLFDRGAPHYDGIVDWGFLRSGSFYRRWALKRSGLRPGQRLLDVACGTGLVAVEAARLLGSASAITCIDPSEGMMTVARAKLPEAVFVKGRAESLPFPDETFDFLTMGYALRHVTDLESTFAEYRRVLKPGGRVLVLEVTKPTGRISGALFNFYFGRLYPFLSGAFTRSRDAKAMMRYYWETMDACVSPDTVMATMRAGGLVDVRRKVLLGIFSEYSARSPRRLASRASL